MVSASVWWYSGNDSLRPLCCRLPQVGFLDSYFKSEIGQPICRAYRNSGAASRLNGLYVPWQAVVDGAELDFELAFGKEIDQASCCDIFGDQNAPA